MINFSPEQIKKLNKQFKLRTRESENQMLKKNRIRVRKVFPENYFGENLSDRVSLSGDEEISCERNHIIQKIEEAHV